ncbi:MAG: 50S ribosomal protein L10, partial [Nanoarchaeota archaeon]
VCLMFSDKDSFELAGILTDNQSPAKAKAGDVALSDIKVEAGPTDLMPGPAISELGAVGLKIAVENGKLAIKNGATIVKEGDVIDSKVASVLGKLNILPMKVGFIPLVAYDAESGMIYKDIKIDKEGALVELKTAIGKAFGFAVNLGYVVKETISYFISKAAMEEKALAAKVEVGGGDKKKAEESAEEAKPEESKVEEEKKEDVQKEKESGE